MANAIGLQLGYWFGTSFVKDIRTAIRNTAEAGFDYAEFNPTQFLGLSSAERRALLSECKEHGLTTSCNGGLMRPDAYLASYDALIVQRALELCERVLEGCAEMESPVWTGVLHGIWGTAPAKNTPEYIRECMLRGIDGVRAACEIAAKYNVTLCLEIVNRYEMFYLNTIRQGIAFCNAVDHPNCRLLIDTFHMAIEEDNMCEAIEEAQKHNMIGCIHVGETNRRLPKGTPGNIDWQAVSKSVAGSGYTGLVTAEPFVFQSPAYSGKVCIWRGLLDADDEKAVKQEAKDSAAFLHSLFR